MHKTAIIYTVCMRDRKWRRSIWYESWREETTMGDEAIDESISLSLHRAFWSLFNLHTPTNALIYIILKKFKIYIKTLKTLLHVSIIRSSSGSTYCSLLKLCIKTISDVLLYLNLVMWQHVVRLYVCWTLCRVSQSHSVLSPWGWAYDRNM